MNYFALAGAIIAGLVAFRSALRIIRVSIGAGSWTAGYGFPINVLIVAVAAPTTFWLVSVATA